MGKIFVSFDNFFFRGINQARNPKKNQFTPANASWRAKHLIGHLLFPLFFPLFFFFPCQFFLLPRSSGSSSLPTSLFSGPGPSRQDLDKRQDPASPLLLDVIGKQKTGTIKPTPVCCWTADPWLLFLYKSADVWKVEKPTNGSSSKLPF